MVHLEGSLVPVLKDQLSFWKRYVDDTITFIKTGSAEYVLLILNSFHPNIEFTYEREVNSKLAVLDVLLLREGQNIITIVYRKVTNSDIYLNWNSFCPQGWKRETLKSLAQRAHLICSTEDLLKTELNHIQKVFSEINDFPLWVIKQIFAEEDKKNKQQNIQEYDSSVINTESGNKRYLLLLPDQGEQGSRLVKYLKQSITRLLSRTTQLEFGFISSKLSTHFQIKDKTIFEHNYDVVYFGTCPENNCSDNYVDESARRISERIIDHNGRDQNSHLFKHSCCKNHPNTSKTDFKIISSGFKNNYYRRKLQKRF